MTRSALAALFGVLLLALVAPSGPAWAQPAGEATAAETTDEGGDAPEDAMAEGDEAPAGDAQVPADDAEEPPAEPTDDERQLRRQVEANEPTMPLTDALAEGYLERPDDELVGSLGGSLMALTVGTVVHGVGHFWVEERTTGIILLATELAAGLVWLAAQWIEDSTNGSGGSVAVAKLLNHLGMTLFVGSYLADIVGTFTGTTPFSPDSTRVEGSTFGVAYRYTDSPLDNFRHHLVGRLNIDTGWVYLRPLIDLEASLDYRRVDLDLGFRVIRGADPHEHVAIGLLGRRLENRADGYALSGVQGYVAGKIDLGRFMRTLRYFYLAGRAGYGLDTYQFSAQRGSVPSLFAPSDFDDQQLTLATGIGFNTGQRTHMLVMWSIDTTSDVPADSLVFPPLSLVVPEESLVGVVDVSLEHRYQDTVDIEVQATIGQGFAIWLGLGYSL